LPGQVVLLDDASTGRAPPVKETPKGVAMRTARWGVFLCVFLSGCWGDVSEPELRRPLETLPAGACLIVVASDLANTWERAEAHNAVDIVRRTIPPTLLARPGIVNLATRLSEFEARTGMRVRDDVLLNALGGRVAMGAYVEGDARDAEVLFVSELADSERFARALDALRAEPDTGVDFEDAELDGQPALRVSDERGLDLLVVQSGALLVLSTTDELARGALAIHAGRSEDSALRDPAFVEAVEELGLHNVVLVEPTGGGVARWRAQGFTWDAEGVHFKRIVGVAPDAELEAPRVHEVHRDAILSSIPTGMTLAYYARPTDVALVRELFLGGEGCFDWRSSQRSGAPHAPRQGLGHGIDRPLDVLAASTARSPLDILPAAPPLGMEQLPFDMAADLLPWVGDEMAFVLAELVDAPLAPIPSAALIVEVADPELADRTLSSFDDVVLKYGSFDFRGFEAVRYGGVSYKTFAQPLFDTVSPSYLVDGEVCIFTTTRELMQLIIDTRRVGKRHLLRDASFRPFEEFVPEDASAVLYADQRRLKRSLDQLSELTWLGGDVMARAVEILDGLSMLFEHFPAGAVYVQATPETLTLNGWMLEAE
jgi:hypothetical protein